MKRIFCAFIFIFLISVTARAEESLTVHEWGTITTQHQADGVPAGSLNRIRPDELLPPFVHVFDTDFLVAFRKTAAPIPGGSWGHPSVTMRLETPVIYFYPGKSSEQLAPIDVEVEFKGGLINEFYPQANVKYENIEETKDGATNLIKDTVGKVKWSGIKLGGEAKGPATDSPIWLAPREVKSAAININGEGEQYLFYRGVAHLNSLLRTTHTLDTKLVSIYSPEDLPASLSGATLSRVWVAGISEEGLAAFKEVGPLSLSQDPKKVMALVAADFKKEDYSAEHLASLQQEIREELVKNGLFPEEAAAMLKTWDKAYFHNPGIRIFFIVPKAWVNEHLPLKFSVPVNLERVIIGRIDLVI